MGEASLVQGCVIPFVLFQRLKLFWQVMPAVVNVMKEEATLVTLVKPQFEARRSQVRM